MSDCKLAQLVVVYLVRFNVFYYHISISFANCIANAFHHFTVFLLLNDKLVILLQCWDLRVRLSYQLRINLRVYSILLFSQSTYKSTLSCHNFRWLNSLGSTHLVTRFFCNFNLIILLHFNRGARRIQGWCKLSSLWWQVLYCLDWVNNYRVSYVLILTIILK